MTKSPVPVLLMLEVPLLKQIRALRPPLMYGSDGIPLEPKALSYRRPTYGGKIGVFGFVAKC